MTANLCPRCRDEWDDLMDVCHSCEARLVMWLTGTHPPVRAQWRRRARDVMRAVVKAHRSLAITDPAALVKLVDAAYTFGGRAMHPYKVWLAERKILVAVLMPEPPPPAPTAEDFAACEVAIDLVELGDVEGAKKLLDEQAPRRLNRACKACGAKVGKACRDVETTAYTFEHPDGQRAGTVVHDKQNIPRIVPHLVRVGEKPRPAPMPLFERSAP